MTRPPEKTVPFDLAAVMAVARPVVDARPVRYLREELEGYLAQRMANRRAYAGGDNRGPLPTRLVLLWADDFIAMALGRGRRMADRDAHDGRKDGIKILSGWDRHWREKPR